MLEKSKKTAQNFSKTDHQLLQSTMQFHPLRVYNYLPSQQQFPYQTHFHFFFSGSITCRFQVRNSAIQEFSRLEGTFGKVINSSMADRVDIKFFLNGIFPGNA